MQECAKICVKKCKHAKNWKIDFADVCIFFFDGSHICRFLPILRPNEKAADSHDGLTAADVNRNNYLTATNTCRPQRRDCIRRTLLRLSDGLTAKWSQ